MHSLKRGLGFEFGLRAAELDGDDLDELRQRAFMLPLRERMLAVALN
ncbi:MAG TPA: hypothetical protein VFB21_17040 [Chthonomonadaceae bacterium]|nr:hypothetical protein [Chthonomonadaceae bacterium]